MSGNQPYTYNAETEELNPLLGHDRRTFLASEADTEADRQSSAIENPNARGLFLHVNLANIEGTPEYTPAVQVESNDSWIELFTASSVLGGSAGDFLYVLYPGATYSGGNNLEEAADIALPRRFRVVLKATTAGGSNRADTLVAGGLLH